MHICSGFNSEIFFLLININEAEVYTHINKNIYEKQPFWQWKRDIVINIIMIIAHSEQKHILNAPETKIVQQMFGGGGDQQRNHHMNIIAYICVVYGRRHSVLLIYTINIYISRTYILPIQTVCWWHHFIFLYIFLCLRRICVLSHAFRVQILSVCVEKTV